WVGLLACDLPFLKPAAFGRLLEHVSEEVDAVAYFSDPGAETYHSCCALYHSRVLSIAEGELARGCRLQEVLRRVRLAALRPSKDEERQLKNVNFPSDMLGQPK
ncbi:MAG: molybdenum cofactor guanylyltransferase, partial [Acidobacteriota bacterium]